MSPTVAYPMLSIGFDREEIEIASFSSYQAPDPNWKYVDSNGHGHFWVKEGEAWDVPTTEQIVIGTYWVGDEYDGVEYEEKERRCLQCAEKVKPGMRTEQAKPVLGPTVVTVTIGDETFVMNEDEYATALDEWKQVLRSIR